MNPRIDEVAEVPCTHCGQPVALTWTKSAENAGVLHGVCWEARR